MFQPNARKNNCGIRNDTYFCIRGMHQRDCGRQSINKNQRFSANFGSAEAEIALLAPCVTTPVILRHAIVFRGVRPVRLVRQKSTAKSPHQFAYTPTRRKSRASNCSLFTGHYFFSFSRASLASLFPWSAALRYHFSASARSFLTPSPF